MANILNWLKDKKGNTIVPKTLTKAIQNEAGETLETTVQNIENGLDSLNTNLENRTFFDASSNTSYEMAINALHKSLPDNTGFNGIMLYDGVGMPVCGARYNSTRGTYILMSPIINTLRKLRVYGNKIYMSEITCNAETSVDVS